MMAKKNNTSPQKMVEDTNVVEETTVETVVEETTEPVIEKAPVKAPVTKKETVELKVGTTGLKIKPECKTTVTGKPIPEFAYKNTYVVTAVLDDRIIIGVDRFGKFDIAVHDYDVIIGK